MFQRTKYNKILKLIVHCNLGWTFLFMLFTVFFPRNIKLALSLSNHKNIFYSCSAFFIQNNLIQWSTSLIAVLMMMYILQQTFLTKRITLLIFIFGGVSSNLIFQFLANFYDINFLVIGSSGGIMTLFGMGLLIIIKSLFIRFNKIYLFIILFMSCLYLNPTMYRLQIERVSLYIHLIGMFIGILIYFYMDFIIKNKHHKIL